jgi:hypothetical protein
MPVRLHVLVPMMRRTVRVMRVMGSSVAWMMNDMVGVVSMYGSWMYGSRMECTWRHRGDGVRETIASQDDSAARHDELELP